MSKSCYTNTREILQAHYKEVTSDDQNGVQKILLSPLSLRHVIDCMTSLMRSQPKIDCDATIAIAGVTSTQQAGAGILAIKLGESMNMQVALIRTESDEDRVRFSFDLVEKLSASPKVIYPMVLVAAVTTNGDACLKAKEILENYTGDGQFEAPRVAGIISLLDMEQNAPEVFAKYEIPFYAAVRVSEIKR